MLTTVEGLQSEIFVPVTPPPVFTELKKPLSECKVAFITAGGIHKKSQTPFNTSGDFSYRTIEFDTPSSELMVTHGGFDNSDINKDVNAMFPIDRLHELVKEGFIGSLPKETYTFMGGGGNVEKFRNETGPEIAKKLKAQGVDIVLCTGGCGTCHDHRHALLRGRGHELLRHCGAAAHRASAGCAAHHGAARPHRLERRRAEQHPDADGHRQRIPRMGPRLPELQSDQSPAVRISSQRVIVIQPPS